MSETTPDGSPAALRVEYCDEWFTVDPDTTFVIGREGDLVIDDNQYLHRSFLALRYDDFWWIDNVGSTLSATVSDADGAMHAWLAPGARLPLLFQQTDVRFTAGPTSYRLGLHLEKASMALGATVMSNDGASTLQPLRLTDRQRAVVLALAETALRNNERTPSTIPSSADAAERLGWKLTTFNRQLDEACRKLAKAGARGLHGGPDKLATNRRARLVEYALASRMISPDDLPLLDQLRNDDG